MSQEPKSDALAERKTYSKSLAAETSISASGNMDFRNIDQIMNFAKLMALAGVAIPKHLRETPGACMAVCIQAAEWQMSPFAVANKSYSVNDRLAYEAQLVNAVILRRAPIIGRFKITYSGEGDKRRCRVAAKLNDGSGEEVEYESPEIGKIPVKNSPLWKGDPDQQLFYYSSRAMCRRHFPDVILGIYTQDELQDMPPEERAATGREVPAAKVPELLPSSPFDTAARKEFSETLTPCSEFMERCKAAGLADNRVFEVLNDYGITEATAFCDMAESECSVALERFEQLAEMVKGGQS